MPSSSPSSASILVVGATGNTGTGAVKWLSHLLSSSSVAAPSSSPLSASVTPPRVVALTRHADSEAAKNLAKLDHVEVVQKDWMEIDSEWLVQSHVFRVYIAPHNLPSQFVDESRFLIACRDAKVEYLVKLSTNGPFIAPDSPIYYGRSHWAVEQLLWEPEFSSMPSTILRANVFINSLVQPSISFIRENFQAGGAADRPSVRLLMSKDAPVALVDPKDVGAAAAALLALPDPSAHHGHTYNLSGPNDVSGEDVIRLIEAKLGEKLTVDYKSMTLANELLDKANYPQNASKSIKLAYTEFLWKGVSRLSMTESSPELLQLNIPRTTVEEYIERAFE